MQIKRLSFTALFSLAVLISCTEDAAESNQGIDPGTDPSDGNTIEVIATIDGEEDEDATTKGTPITEGIAVTSLGIFSNQRTPTVEGGVDVVTFIENYEIVRNIYGKLEFLKSTYWPPMAEGQTLGFIAYSPYSDVYDGVTGTTTSSGISNVESRDMLHLSLDYVVPQDVKNQPDLLISEPVEQSSGAVSLTLSHALATIVFNVKGDGVQPVKSIVVTNIASDGSLDLNYTWDTATSKYVPDFDWTCNVDDVNSETIVSSFTLSLANETLTEVYPSDDLTSINSASGYLMMIPQEVTSATEIVVTFVDDTSRSLRFFDTQDWQAGGIYSYNINIDFEGEVVDLSDIDTVDKLVGYDSSEATGYGPRDLETANCYIINPPIYTSDLSGAAVATSAETKEEDLVDAPIYFTRTEGDAATASASVSTSNYGALYYIPISSQMEEYYHEYCGGDVPDHEKWLPEILWYDSPLNPVDNEVSNLVIKRVDPNELDEERFSIYVPHDYANFGSFLISVKDDYGAIIWSWHIWVTDYNPYYDHTHNAYYGSEYDAKATGNTGAYKVLVEGGELHHYTDYAQSTVWHWGDKNYYKYRLIMDRNLGALDSEGSAYAADDRSMGMYYQYGRKDPFPHTETYKALDKSYSITWNTLVSIDNSIALPTTFFARGNGASNGTANGTNWCSVKETTYVWNDKRYTTTDITNAAEYKKSLFDPSPIGFMVPTINAWNDFRTDAYSSSTVTVTTGTNGVCYKAPEADLYVYYPMAGGLSGSSHSSYGGYLYSAGQSGCWTSTPSTITNHSNYTGASNYADLFFYDNSSSIIRMNDSSASYEQSCRTQGWPVRPIQRWYGPAPGETTTE